MKKNIKSSLPKAQLGTILKGVKSFGKGVKKLNDMRPMVKGSKTPFRKKGDLTKTAVEGAVLTGAGGTAAYQYLDKVVKPRENKRKVAANKVKVKANTEKVEANKAKYKMGTGKYKFADGGSSFGMLSVKAGVDKNPKPTAADRIAGAKMNKKKMGGKTKMQYGGTKPPAVKPAPMPKITKQELRKVRKQVRKNS